MNFPTPLSPSQALRRLLDQVMAGRDAVVDGPGASLVLDQAAAALAARRSRVLRAGAAGPGGLGLQELMTQVAGRPDLHGPGDASLEQGARALTVPDEGCDRIVLLLDDAEAVQPAALRYLQLACRTGAKLRLVLVGLPERLDGVEFAPLRARLQAQPVLVLDGSLPEAVPDRPAPRALAPPAACPDQPAGARRLAAPPSGRPQVAALAAPRWIRPAAAALGMAACAMLGVLAAGRAPEPLEALAAAAQPAPPPLKLSEAPVSVTEPPAAEAPAAPASASASFSSPAAVQPAPEPLSLAAARPPGRRGTPPHPAETRSRALLPHGARRSLVRLPRMNSGQPPAAAQPYGTWDEPRTDAWDEEREPPHDWPGRGWRPNARPWPVFPPGAYPEGPYAGSAYPDEQWRRVNPWWPR